MAQSVDVYRDTLPTTEEAVEEFIRQGGHGEVERGRWFADHREAIRRIPGYDMKLRREMDALSEAIGDIIDDDYGTDIEVEFIDVHRPVRSHLPPVPCLMVYMTHDSNVSKELMSKLRRFSRSNGKSLEKVRGLCVSATPVGNIRGSWTEVGPYISSLANFLQGLGSSAQMGFNLVQIELDDSDVCDEGGHGPPCGFRGTPDDFSHFASVLQESCNNLTFFRFYGNILAQPANNSDVDLDLMLMAIQNCWSPDDGDHFSIVSNNFLRYAHAMSFIRFTPFRCKVHITCLRSTRDVDLTGLDKFVDGVVLPTTSVRPPADSVVLRNPELELAHLHLSLFFPLNKQNECSIRKLLRENRRFVMITISESDGSGRVAGSTFQGLCEASFRGYTKSVRFNVQPNFESANESVRDIVAVANQLLPHNTALEAFDPFHWYVKSTGYFEEHELLMAAVQPFLDSNKAKRRRLST